MIGWSPCLEMDSGVELHSIDSGDVSLSAAAAVTDAPSFDASDMTFEFTDQNYRFLTTKPAIS